MAKIVSFPKDLMAGSTPALSTTLPTTYETSTKFLSKRARVRAANGKNRKALANKDQSPLKGWEYPAGSGIRIREVINRFNGKDCGISYRVSVPAKLAGRRILKQFSDPDLAEKWAKEQHGGLKATGRQHFDLTPAEREDAIDALALLKETGLSLTQAVKLAKQHFRSATEAVTVENAIKIMLAEKEAENLRPRSIRDLRNRLKPFAESFGDQPIHEIQVDDIRLWLDELKGLSKDSVKGLSARSKKNYVVTLKTFFNFVIGKGWRSADDNPAARLSIPKIDWTVPSILTVPEAETLVNTAATHNNGELLAYVALGLFAGIRTNELQQLTWEMIDLDEGIVTIDATIAKKRRLRVIELTSNCIAWLKLAPNRKGRLFIGHIDLKIAEVVRKAGFANWREEKSNAMRHSFGTYHYALHQNAAHTSAALGHRANDQVLFDSYRSLARKKDGEAYFAINPPAER